MRVISGSARGQKLLVPQLSIVRPATDLVKGAIFSILENMAVDWAMVLDLFSGSGSLGIEALSRGAGWVDFVDREARCCAIIRQNLQKTGLDERSHIYCTSVGKAVAFLSKEYNIILMDPPYRDTGIAEEINQLAESRLVSDRSVVVITHSTHLALSSSYGKLKLTKERRHGDSIICIYKKEVQTCPSLSIPEASTR